MKKLLKAWWNRNSCQFYKKVETIEEAIEWLREQTQNDLQNQKVTWNAGGLMEFDESFVSDDEDGWCEYYNEDGDDIMAIIDKIDENEAKLS